ncbi:MAG: hypothetical protein IT474_04220 [Arenimonas sp.]|nr:hypothetical protein [Arenimonas sp.]
MKNIRENWGEYLIAIIVVSFLCLPIGAITNYRPVLLFGFFGLAILSVLMVLGILGFIHKELNELIPEFKGKQLAIGTILVLALAALVLTAFSGGSDVPCAEYRGEPTC